MKLKNLPIVARPGRTILTAAVAIFSASALHAGDFFTGGVTFGGTTINLGDGSGGNGTGQKSWAILGLGGNISIGGYDGATSYNGNPEVVGNVGLNGGSFSISGYAVVDKGDIWRASTSQSIGGTAGSSAGNSYTGSLNTDSTYMTQAQTDAVAASNAAKTLANSVTGLAFTGALATFTNSSPATFALNAAATISTTVVANYVLNLGTLALSASTAILNINAPAGANFIINVGTTFGLSNAAKITLSGGLQPQSVLFNLPTITAAGMSGNSQLSGIVLAPKATFTMTGTGSTQITGELIAKAVTMSSGSKVINPIVSP